MPRQNTTSPRAPAWQKAFLTILRETGNVSEAARATGIERSTAYDRRNGHASFAALWDDALEEATDALEAEARRRAYDGWDEPVYGRVGKDQDGQIGLVRKYSDSLMNTLLKGNRPEKFKDRQQVEHTGGINYKVYTQSDDFNPEDA